VVAASRNLDVIYRVNQKGIEAASAESLLIKIYRFLFVFSVFSLFLLITATTLLLQR
jgi:hypothetical protein